ncbi:MAG: TonB-dependent receptor [Porticoccaceae bacterium]|nr:TonB-dependent receptor [Porticoccaceae bacterium]
MSISRERDVIVRSISGLLSILKSKRRALVVAIAFMSALPAAVNGEETQRFSIPEQKADKALTLFAVQTGLIVLFPYEPLSKVVSNRLDGDYSASEAISIILDGTGFTGELAVSGEIIIRRDGESAMKKIQKWLLGVLGATSVTGSMSAAAQDSPQRILEEITVTAQKRAESLMDVPIALSAFTDRELENFGISGAQGLAMSTPAIVYPTTGPYAQPYIRGVGSRLLQNGLDPSVATYIDGRYISRQSAIMLDLADIARVEVLKGPQGVLFGRNSSAGAIRMITKNVSDELEGSVKVSAGNYDYRAVSGSVNVPLTDNFGILVSGMTKKRDGYADNIFPAGVSEMDDLDTEGLRGKFRWDISERSTLGGSLSYWSRDDNEGNDNIALGPLELNTGIFLGGISGQNINEVATALDGTIQVEEVAGEINFSHSFDHVDFTSITTYAEMDDNILAIEADGTSTVAVDATIYEQTETYSQEFQLASTEDGALNWLAGIYFFNDKTDFDSTVDIGTREISQGFQSVETTAWAGFGQLKWSLNEDWAVTLGGRYSYEEKEVVALASPYVALTVSAFPYEDDKSWSEFTPKLTIERLFDQGMVYLTYARGFKSGGFNYPVAGTQPLDPEILDMYEVGLKGDFFDNTLRLTMATYYYDYADLQVTRAAAEGTAIVTTENASDAEIYGVDVDFTWIATDRMSITGGFSLQDSQYKDYIANAKFYNAVLGTGPAGMSDIGFDADGETLLRAPKVAAFLSANYDFVVGEGTMPLVISYSYKGSYDFDFSLHPTTEALQNDGYGILNARLSYVPPSESWTISVWGNNLTDKEYFQDVVAAGVGLRGSYGAPRTYGVDVSYRF